MCEILKKNFKLLEKNVRLTCNLALLPQTHISEGWSNIVDVMQKNHLNIEQFKKYFSAQWFNSIKTDMW